MSNIIKPLARLSRVIGPTEVLVGSPNPVLIADLTDVARGEAVCVIQNNGAASIFICLFTGIGAGTPSGTPTLTTSNGVPIVSGGYLVLDNIGGMAVWGVAAAVQVAGTGTRVTGGKTTV